LYPDAISILKISDVMRLPFCRQAGFHPHTHNNNLVFVVVVYFICTSGCIRKIYYFKHMPNLEMTIPHSLSQEEAIKRIKNQFTEMKKNHGDKIKNFKEDWKGNVGNFSFRFQSFDISGMLTVDHSSVEMAGKIPLAVSLFKEAIKKTIYDKAVEILS
jgi:hypothetical protein